MNTVKRIVNKVSRTTRVATILVATIGLFSLTALADQATNKATKQAPSQKPIQHLSVMLDWFVNPNHAPIIIAKQQGLFEKAGLDVDIQEPADPSLPPKLVAANQVDLAITYEPNFILNISQGLPLKYASALIDTPLNTIIVRKDSGIKSISDLKGKTIGISVTGTEEATIGTMLNDSGLSLSDVKLINVGWNLSVSLASKQVDAVFGGMSNFEPNQLELEGIDITIFAVQDHGVPPYEELIFVMNQKSKKAVEIAKFNQALNEATLYIQANPEKSWSLFKSYQHKGLDTELNHRAWFDTIEHLAATPKDVATQPKTVQQNKIDAYQAYADFLYQNKLLDKSIDVSLSF